jgi:predicted Rossmann-fold nucleotide-binding protein
MTLELNEGSDPKAVQASLQSLARRMVTGLSPLNLPRHIADLVIADIFAQQYVQSRNADHSSFLDAYLALRDHKTIGVFGGSRLEQSCPAHESLFRPFNRALGRLLQDGGWSVVSGGGPGTAMKGLQYCLKDAYCSSRPRNCRAVSIASGLNDEKLHRHANIIVRTPEDITIRERMIYGLSKVGLFYPGHIGTIAEGSEALLQNYVKERGPYPYDPAPMVLVSYKLGDGTHYWQNFLNQFQDTSVREGLSKGESYEWLKMIVLPSQQEVGSMTTQDRDWLFARKAEQVMMFADQWINGKYGHTLNGGFGSQPVDLSDYTI